MKKILLSMAFVAAFGMPVMAQTDENPQEIEVSVWQEDFDLSPFETTVTFVSDGVYNIDNVANSGAFFTFKFDDSVTPDEEGWVPAEFTSVGQPEADDMKWPLYTDQQFRWDAYNDDYILMNAGSVAVGSLKNNADGSDIAINTIGFEFGNSRVNLLEDDIYSYYGQFGGWWVFGGDWKWINMNFYFDKYEGEGAAVSAIEAENAPVEYYNLQGVKVANPENGLYIVKQGNKSKKVMVRK